MTHSADLAAGAKPARMTRRWIVLAAGVLALCLQWAALMMSPVAMQGVMQAMAQSQAQAQAQAQDDAQSFAATCLNLGLNLGKWPDGQPVKSDDHSACPICVTLAQVQGAAATPIALPTAQDWVYQTLTPAAAHLSATRATAAAFASRAPPFFAIA